MASLVTASEITVFTGDFKNLFDTFKRQLVVHKEPKKVVTSLSTTLYAGYRPQNQTKTEYIPQTGIYDAMITYADKGDNEYFEDLKAIYAAGDARIKVEADCMHFIEGGGKTERIEFDSISYNIKTSISVKNFFGFKLYVYHLERSK
jgi:hypothetical protein